MEAPPLDACPAARGQGKFFQDDGLSLLLRVTTAQTLGPHLRSLKLVSTGAGQASGEPLRSSWRLAFLPRLAWAPRSRAHPHLPSLGAGCKQAIKRAQLGTAAGRCLLLRSPVLILPPPLALAPWRRSPLPSCSMGPGWRSSKSTSGGEPALPAASGGGRSPVTGTETATLIKRAS